MTRRHVFLFTALLMSPMFAAAAWGESSSGSKTLAERLAALRRGFSPAAAESGEAVAETSAAPQSATSPRAGSVPQTPAQETGNRAALPGLGGSPLPQGKWTPRNGAAGRTDVARELSADYPVIRDIAADKSAESRRSDAAAESPTANSPSRHSPHLRSTPHINPDELQRELAGSFSSSRSGPATRTARANGRAQAESPSAEEPFALPQVEAAAPVIADRPAKPLKVQAPQSESDAPAPSSASAAEAFGATTDAHDSLGGSSFARSPRLNSNEPATPIAADPMQHNERFGEALQMANGGDPTVLLSNQTPTIRADIRGPKQILVGREAVYRVRLENQGATAADGIVATVRIPSWADVVGTAASQGSVQPSQNATTPTNLEWQLSRIEGRASETLDIQLVPREGRPLELGITWTVAPVGSRAIVEVQEPKLQLDVAGPNEVLFAKPQVFRLTLSNPGTGPAENVKIDLVPPGTAQETVTSHPFGSLKPGESKTVEIELTAREAGKLQVKAIASAEGGLTTDVSKEIFCRKPELEVDWRGPASQYAGTIATYFFRVRNPGTAPAEDVAVQVTLPEAAEFATASEGQSFDVQRRQVTWRVGTLAPGDDNYMELKCVVKKPGVNEFQIAAATSAGDLTDSATAETSVIALADLKLEVRDPSGAVAVGSPAVYDIRVMNRGTNSARDVSVVALFSEGIEPDQAEGAMYTVADGRVAFRPIDDLAPGREVTLRIRAHAIEAGTHVFRVEVHCRDAEIKLAAEETTRFYTDDVPAEAAATRQPQATASRQAFETAPR